MIAMKFKKKILPDSFKVLIKAGQYAFKSFLFKIVELHFAKQRPKKAAVSAFTDGFLLSRPAKTSS